MGEKGGLYKIQAGFLVVSLFLIILLLFGQRLRRDEAAGQKSRKQKQ